MISRNENENEKTLNRVHALKEEIYEAKAYISSEFCRRCTEMYDKLSKLEHELRHLQNTLHNNET